jgi:hypothetical protein
MRRRLFFKYGLAGSSFIMFPSDFKGFPIKELPDILLVGDSISIG